MLEVYPKPLVTLAPPTFFKLELDMGLRTVLLRTLAAMAATFVAHIVEVASSDVNLRNRMSCNC